MRRGKFIVVDGNEGAGKSTMMRAAGEIYGRSLFLTREIGGSPMAETIRHLMFSSEEGKQASAETQFNLAWAARADHLENEIKPKMNEGMNVLSDRFDSSTYAYQIFAQDGEDLKPLFELEREIILKDYQPDLYILLDVLPKTGLARRRKDKGELLNDFDQKELDFYDKVRAGFSEFFKKVPHRIIDANKPLEKVRAEFLGILEEVFGKAK